jgi:phage shock protein PspC (stress-responsive transcriptional regulator)
MTNPGMTNPGMTNPGMANPAPEIPATTPTRPPLQRSSTDRMLGGVCGGLAAYTGLDPVLWRVGMVALTLIGPGVLVYLLLWVLMPTGPGHTPGPLDAPIGRLHDAVGSALNSARR